jgi:hypothetical protein
VESNVAQTDAQKALQMLADKRRADQLKALKAQADQARAQANCNDCNPRGKR